MGACCEALGLPIPLLSTEYPNYLTWRNGRKSEAVVVPAPISDARRVRAAVGLLLTPLPDAAKKTGPSVRTLPRPPPLPGHSVHGRVCKHKPVHAQVNLTIQKFCGGGAGGVPTGLHGETVYQLSSRRSSSTHQLASTSRQCHSMSSTTSGISTS